MRLRNIVLIAFFCANSAAQPTSPAPRLKPLSQLMANASERTLFVAVETFAREPADQQEKDLPVFYRLTSPPLMGIAMEKLRDIPINIFDKDSGKAPPEDNYAPVYVMQMKSDFGTSHTPEQVADAILAAHNDPGLLTIVARQRAIAVMDSQRNAVSKLVAEDLESKDFDRAVVAFNVTSSVGLYQPIDQITAIYLADEKRSDAAKTALVWVEQPEYAQPLLKDIEQNPARVSRHYELLASMLKDQPVPDVLLKLLDSPTLEIRRDAARSLVQCQDARLGPYVTKLSSDRDYDLRMALVKIGFALPDEAFKKARLDLVFFLHAQKGVQYQALRGFAHRKDQAAAEVMLDLLKQPSMDPVGIAEVRAAFQDLTDDALDFDFEHWGPGNTRNDNAIKDFQSWLDENRGKLANGVKLKADL